MQVSIFSLLLLLSFSSCAQPTNADSKINSGEDKIVDENGINQQWDTDLSKKTIKLSEITVLLEQDGIPPIDKPKFISADNALKAFYSQEPVIAFEHKGIARAYPLSVLMWHEIVNDQIEDLSFIVTYCPLCNAAIVFNRALLFKDHKYLLDFGVSGMLRNSDMVMWDRQTESWWQQFMGEGLVGTLAGAELEVLSSMVISLEDFLIRFPEGEVLSTDNGVDRQYGINPYTNYDEGLEDPWGYKGEIDRRLAPTQRVIDICIGEQCIVYPWHEISKQQVIHDSPYGESIVLFFEPGAVTVMGANNIREARAIGSVTVFKPQIDGRELVFTKQKKGFKDQQTGSIWDITGNCIQGEYLNKTLTPVAHGNHFAFAWFAFHPDTPIYNSK